MARSATASSRGAALVTGPSSGIGEQIAIRLARAGYNLVLVARNEASLAAIGERLTRDHDVSTTPLPMDLAQADAALTIAERVRALGIDVEILINNAGYAVSGAFAASPSHSELDMLQVNVMALVQLTREFLPAMIANGRGRVMNLASTATFVPGPFMAGYYASKAFVLSFSQAVNAELRDSGVTVTAVCPGPTATNFAKRAGVTETRLFRRGTMSAEDVADAAVDGMMAGKAVVIPGVRNKLLSLGSRLTPRQVLVGMARRFNEARS